MSRPVRKPDGKRQLERPTPSCEDNIKMDVKQIGSADWVYQPQNRDQWRAVVYNVMNLRVQ
jgi:hypothetical protein